MKSQALFAILSNCIYYGFCKWLIFKGLFFHHSATSFLVQSADHVRGHLLHSRMDDFCIHALPTTKDK